MISFHQHHPLPSTQEDVCFKQVRCILICLTYPYTNTVVYYTWTLQTVGSVTLKKEKKLNGGGI